MMSVLSDSLFPDPNFGSEVRQWEPDEWERILPVRATLRLVAEKSGDPEIQEVAALMDSIPMYAVCHGRTLLFPSGNTICTPAIRYFSVEETEIAELFKSCGIPLKSVPLSEGRWKWTTNGWMRNLAVYNGDCRVMLFDPDFITRPIEGPQCLFHELAHAKHGLAELLPTQLQLRFLAEMLKVMPSGYHRSIRRVISDVELILSLL